MSLFGNKKDARVACLVKDVEELRKKLNSLEARHAAETAEYASTFTMLLKGYAHLAKLVVRYKEVVEELVAIVGDQQMAVDEQEQELALPDDLLPSKDKKDLN